VRPEGGVPIIKSGSDAKVAAVVQLWLGPSRAVEVQVTAANLEQALVCLFNK